MNKLLEHFSPEILLYGLMVAEVEKLDPNGYGEINKRYDDIMIPYRRELRRGIFWRNLSSGVSELFDNATNPSAKPINDDKNDIYEKARLSALIGYLKHHPDVAEKVLLNDKAKGFFADNLGSKTPKELQPYLGL